jgi:hypothetical protein
MIFKKGNSNTFSHLKEQEKRGERERAVGLMFCTIVDIVVLLSLKVNEKCCS